MNGEVFRTGRNSLPRDRGILLFNCLIYLVVFLILIGLGFVVLTKFVSFHGDFKRIANDITRTLRAGEQWRADVRKANGPIEISQDNWQSIFVIPLESERIIYRFDRTNVWKVMPGGMSELSILKNVEECRFVMDQREEVVAWNWEIVLKTKKRRGIKRPLFSFIAAEPGFWGETKETQP